MEPMTVLTPQEIEGLRAAGRAPGETLLEFVGRLNASRRRAQGEVAEALAIVQREMELEPGTRLAEAVEMLAADDRELARRLEESTVTALQEANEHVKAEAERKAKTEERERRFAAEAAEWRRKLDRQAKEYEGLLCEVRGSNAALWKRIDSLIAAAKHVGRTAAAMTEGDAEAEKAWQEELRAKKTARFARIYGRDLAEGPTRTPVDFGLKQAPADGPTKKGPEGCESAFRIHFFTF